MKRRLADNALPNARKELIPNGGGTERWVIPLSDLLAQGLRPNAARKGDGAPKPDVDLTAAAGSEDQAQNEVERLRRELAESQRRAVLAEAVAAERLRALDDARLNADALRQAVLMLNAGAAPRERRSSRSAAAAGGSSGGTAPHWKAVLLPGLGPRQIGQFIENGPILLPSGRVVPAGHPFQRLVDALGPELDAVGLVLVYRRVAQPRVIHEVFGSAGFTAQLPPVGGVYHRA